MDSLAALQQRIIACQRCSRLVQYCAQVARDKRRMYRDQEYWGKPVPSFGDPKAQLLVLGLAPAAHGGNRTGRVFTGDRSGDFLFRALYEAGFSNQPESRQRGDGLKLPGCYITAALHCAPPGNKGLPEEFRNCRPYLEEELRILKNVRAVLALGKIAFDNYLRVVFPRAESERRLEKDIRRGSARAAEVAESRAAWPRHSSFKFAHDVSYDMPGGWPRLFGSYHPSQQNTQTGKLTPAMMRRVFTSIRAYLDRKGT